MEQKMCKSKKCQRVLPDGYKHKYCENCMGKRAGVAKNVLKGAAGAVCTIGGIVVFVATKGKFGGGKA